MNINQYRIVIVNLDPTIGSEIKKTIPCLVISPDEMNQNLNTIVIAPITSAKSNYPTRIKILVNRPSSRAAIDQLRTIDKKRVVSIEGMITPKEIIEVKSIINETFLD